VLKKLLYKKKEIRTCRWRRGLISHNSRDFQLMNCSNNNNNNWFISFSQFLIIKKTQPNQKKKLKKYQREWIKKNQPQSNITFRTKRRHNFFMILCIIHCTLTWVAYVSCIVVVVLYDVEEKKKTIFHRSHKSLVWLNEMSSKSSIKNVNILYLLLFLQRDISCVLYLHFVF
jgi:exopolysaccharide biosynthesis protein